MINDITIDDFDNETDLPDDKVINNYEYDRNLLNEKKVKLEIQKIIMPNSDYKIPQLFIEKNPHSAWNYLPEELQGKKNLIIIPMTIDYDLVNLFILTHKKINGLYSYISFKSNSLTGSSLSGSIWGEPFFYEIESKMYILNFSVVIGNGFKTSAYLIFDDLKIKDIERKIFKFIKNYENYYDKMEGQREFNQHYLDRVFLRKGLKEDVISDFSSFIKSQKEYKDLNIPWKRGYLFSGPPGNGKTLFLRSLSNAFDIEKYNLIHFIDRRTGQLEVPLAKYNELPVTNYLDIHQLAFYNKKNVKPKIYYLEDIDKVIGRNSQDLAEMSLSTFLNAIDGVDTIGNGFILIATTNYLDELAEAVVGRPGRFDRIIEFENPEKLQIEEFFKYYNFKVMDKKDEVTHKIINGLNGYSMSFVEEFIKASKMKVHSNMINYKDAMEILNKIHKHGQLKQKMKEKIGF